MAIRSAEIYLKTKLIHPQVRGSRVLRRRLIDRLDGAFSVPLTLVCAPAGYGKTTLLVDWAQNCRVPVAWLSLDGDENDPARFLAYLILAVQQIQPELGKSVQLMLNLPEEQPLENGLRLLVNDLAELREPAALVLDDYHLVTARPVHQLLGFLIEHLPPTFHIIIASRTEPALALARLRARSAVLELRAADLSFRADEIEDFLNQVMRLNLSAEVRGQIEQHTEGWAAGLQLAALSLFGGEGGLAPDVLRSGQHYIFDYLAEEVLCRLPEPMQRFLMRTAILDQLSGPLCEALVEPFPPCTSGAECLDALEHANLFTQALDGEHRWYRYHALFAGFLRERLKQIAADQIPEIHACAARWLAEQGSFEQACKHAQAGRDQELLVWLIETYAQALEKQGELGVLARWINVLPEEVVRARPRLCLARAWIYAARLDVRSISLYLDLAEQNLASGESPALRGEMLAARAFVAGINDRPVELQAYTEQALRSLPDEKHFLNGLLKINLSFPHMLSGHIPEAIQLLEEGIQAGIQSHSLIIALLGMRILGEAYLMNGRILQAEQSFQRALEYIESQLGKNSPIRGMALLGLGEAHRQRNNLQQAERLLTEGLEKTMDWMPAMGMDGFLWLSALKQSIGQPAEAQMLLQQARQVSDATTFPLLDGWFIANAAVRLDITQGYLEEGLHWARDTGLNVDTLSNLDQLFREAPNHFRETAFYTLAQLFLILGRRENMPGALEKAARILAKALPMSESAGSVASLLEGLLLLAQVEQALGQGASAQDTLHRALDLAAPEQPLRLFLDQGLPLRELLVERLHLAERGKVALPAQERAFVETLLAAWDPESVTPQPAPQARPIATEPRSFLAGETRSFLVGETRSFLVGETRSFLVGETLSFREMEVLRCMAGGQSNQEIADGLVLSLNTVKKHVSAIIAKLQARNRVQAVLFARQKGLIDNGPDQP